MVSTRKLASAGYLAVWNPQETRAKYAYSTRLEDQAEEYTEEPAEEDAEDADAADASPPSALAKQVPAEALYDVLVGWKKGLKVKIEDVMSQERHTEPPRRF
jgi:hypothetical protein